MMPDLPNVGVERDMESFREFFESPLFRADGLKIYPTLVIRGTGLYELWKTGRIFITKLSQKRWSLFVVIIWQMKAGKHFCHMKIHGRISSLGYGTLLMEEAERIARKEHRSTKIGVISGVGTRHYYRKLGYELEGPYM
ncbi:hypothetical protein TSUD_383630, partial [Trifolium subterraneum]